MMQVILSNSKHPEYGQATIPFPLAQDQYDDCVELLEKLEIGSATEQDCKVLEISSAFPVLKRMEINNSFQKYQQHRCNSRKSEHPRCNKQHPGHRQTAPAGA